MMPNGAGSELIGASMQDLESAVKAERYDYIYVMGAGRSGTTLMSVMLGAHPRAGVRGELLHFPDYWRDGFACSCGQSVRDCSFWTSAGASIETNSISSVDAYVAATRTAERHWRSLQYLLFPRSVGRWYHEALRCAVEGFRKTGIVVDASKYVARAIALASIPGVRVAFVYVVRDARGVLYSFSKPVQRPKSTFAAATYYMLVNGVAQLAIWTRLRSRSIKVRYEDLVANPDRELARIGSFLGLDMSSVVARIDSGDALAIGHMVSGNRIRTHGGIKVGLDTEWRELSLVRRLGYYLLCFPLQIINRYRF